MNQIALIGLMVVVAAFVSAVSGAEFDRDPTPPIGWFFVVLLAEFMGAALATVIL